ncbi:MAG TPA: hypothetical protein VEC36_13305 [Patescibacteria group bacterium]|nr:hypothetical protein [Patescibacteria group bacterium]
MSTFRLFPAIIKSYFAVIGLTVFGAFTLQSLIDRSVIEIGWPTNGPEEIIGGIILSIIGISIFNLLYFSFLENKVNKRNGSGLGILVLAVAINILFTDYGAIVCLIPFNIATICSYFFLKKFLNHTFKIWTLLVQELLLLVILTFLYLLLKDLLVWELLLERYSHSQFLTNKILLNSYIGVIAIRLVWNGRKLF